MLEVFLLIVFTVAMMVGPIMMIKPTKRQKKLSELRALAGQKKLHIRMVTNPASNDPKFIASYTMGLNLHKNARIKMHQHQIVRKKYAHKMHFNETWDWLGTSALSNFENTFLDNSSNAQILIKQYLERLPDTVMGLEINQSGVGILWLERSSEKTVLEDLEIIYNCLSEITSYIKSLN